MTPVRIPCGISRVKAHFAYFPPPPEPHHAAAAAAEKVEAAADAGQGEPGLEWYIKLFLGVHFAANWVSVH